MPLPPYDAFKVETLRLHLDGRVHSIEEVRSACIHGLKLTEEDLQERMRSGRSRFACCISWSLADLRAAGLIQNVARGKTVITERGRIFWADTGGKFVRSDFERYPEYLEFKGLRGGRGR